MLGVDPGSRFCGYGVVDLLPLRKFKYVECGVIEPLKTRGIEYRLGELARWLTDVVNELRPGVIAVEDCFAHRNVRSTIALAQARGTVMAVAGMVGIPVFSYAPKVVKRSVTGRGAASKEQVARMIQALLNLKNLPQSDAADALAVAMTHGQKTFLEDRGNTNMDEMR